MQRERPKIKMLLDNDSLHVSESKSIRPTIPQKNRFQKWLDQSIVDIGKIFDKYKHFIFRYLVLALMLYLLIHPLEDHIFVVISWLKGDSSSMLTPILHIVLWLATVVFTIAFWKHYQWIQGMISWSAIGCIAALIAILVIIQTSHGFFFPMPVYLGGILDLYYKTMTILLIVCIVLFHQDLPPLLRLRNFLEKLESPFSQYTSVVLVMLVISMLASVIVLVTTSKYGIGLSPDSTNYITTATNIARGRGYNNFLGDPFVYWPPLYPFVLSIFERAGISSCDGAQILNAFLLGALSLSIGAMLLYWRIATYRAMIAVVVTFLLVPHIYVFSYAWSEPLFIFLSWIAYLFTLRYVNKPTIGRILTASVLMSTVTLTRYAGIFFVVGVDLFLLAYFLRRIRLKKLIGHLILFNTVVATPLAAWLLFNFTRTGTLTGRRDITNLTFMDNFLALINSCKEYFFQSSSAIFAAFLLLSTVAVLVSLFSSKPTARMNIISLAFLMVLSFLAFLGISASAIKFDSIGPRLISPIGVFVLVSTVIALDSLIRLSSICLVRTFMQVFGILIFFSLLFGVSKTATGLITHSALYGSGGVNSDFYRQSDILSEVNQYNTKNSIIYAYNEASVTKLKYLLWQQNNHKIKTRIRLVSTCYHKTSTRTDSAAQFLSDIHSKGNVTVLIPSANYPNEKKCDLSLPEMSQWAVIAKQESYPEGDIVLLKLKKTNGL